MKPSSRLVKTNVGIAVCAFPVTMGIPCRRGRELSVLECPGAWVGRWLRHGLHSSAGGLNFGALPTATLSLGGNGGGTSGFIIDNDSTQAGVSHIYFGNLQDGHAVQASQAALQ